MTTTLEVASKYVELCKNHQNHIALETLFSPEAVSVEAMAMPGMAAEVRGLAAIMAKGKAWMDAHEIHSAAVEGPWPNGDRFVVRFTYDVTNRPSGRRMQMDEMALFTIQNGKIVREEFFYTGG